MQVKQFFNSSNIVYKAHDTALHKCRYRPDFLFEKSDLYVVVEVDERQHSNTYYNRKGEDSRMLAIAKELAKPTVFIRFNPDDYSSDFQTQFNDRLQYLLHWLRMCYNYTPKNKCEKIYLFYDGWNPNNVIPITVVDTELDLDFNKIKLVD